MLIETGRAVAHQWMCDHMGHLNTRFYAAIADDASFQFLNEIAPHHAMHPRGLGWADVSFALTLRNEVRPGTIIRIRSRLVRLGKSSLTHIHHLCATDLSAEYAEAEIVTVLFDLEARRSATIDDAMRAHCEKLLSD